MKLHTINCKECGTAVGFSFDEQPAQFAAVYCYLCMHNICDVADVLDATQVPRPIDLYAAAASVQKQPMHDWRNTIVRWHKANESLWFHMRYVRMPKR